MINVLMFWFQKLVGVAVGQEQIANKCMKRCLTCSAVRDMHIKTALRFHLTPVRIAAIRKANDMNSWPRCGERGTLIHCWWAIKWRSYCRNECELKIECP